LNRRNLFVINNPSLKFGIFGIICNIEGEKTMRNGIGRGSFVENMEGNSKGGRDGDIGEDAFIGIFVE
jgi:hypothetical protein